MKHAAIVIIGLTAIVGLSTISSQSDTSTETSPVLQAPATDLYEQLLDEFPQDADQPYLTIIYTDRQRDVTSHRLRAAFNGHPWLQALMNNTHYRRIDTNTDATYQQVLAAKVPTTPAVLLTKPPRSGTNEGDVIYLRYGDSLPLDGDTLAREISAAIRTAYHSGSPYIGDCDGPNCPQPDQRPWRPDQDSLPNWPPKVPDLMPSIFPQVDSTTLILAGLALAAFAFMALRRR